MAKVTLAPFIESISGKVGNLQFRTLKSGRTIVHARRESNWDNRPTRIPTEAEIARRRRFGIVARITGMVQSEYKRIDEAAAARQKIWNRVGRKYDKVLLLNPGLTDEEMIQMIWKGLKPSQK